LSTGLRSRRSFVWGMAGITLLQWGRGMNSSAQAKLDGPSVTEAIQALKPGQYLWSPAIAPTGPVLLIVNLKVQRANVYRNGVLIGVSTISSGKKGHETPTGIFTVLQKHIDHKSNIYDSAPMPYMQRLTWTGIALHAGHLPGYPASHGCVRMPLAFAKLLYSATKLGMTVVVTDTDSIPRLAPTPDLLQSVAANTAAVQGNGFWTPEKAPKGPVSFVLSGADKRLIVLRNGVIIGSSPIEIAGQVEQTSAYSLAAIDAQGPHWMQLPLPGQSWKGKREMLPEERSRVNIPEEFRRSINGLLVPGVTLVVTADSLQESETGQGLTVLDAVN
jgi:hypothetical protein